MPQLEPVSLEQLDRLSSKLEGLVDQSPMIDRWCSGPDWSIPTNRAFAPDCERYVVGDPARGVALLARYRSEDKSTTISGLEPLWGFGSPLLGDDPVGLTKQMAAVLEGDQDWDVLVLPGLAVSTEILNDIAAVLTTLGEVGVGIAIEREVADLRLGHEPWLERRSPRFRRNLRRAERAAEEAGIAFSDVSADNNTFYRLLAIEERSWKGKEASGIAAPEMGRLYEELMLRLARAGRLRLTVAQRDGHDVGFILGGVRNDIYRGLQLSYDEDVASLSVGHLLQWRELGKLADSDDVAWYDLGMSIEYKAQWSDHRIPSPVLIVTRR